MVPLNPYLHTATPHSSPYKNRNTEKVASPPVIYYCTWLNISHVPVRPIAPWGHTDTQRSYSMFWVHSEIAHPQHRNTQGMQHRTQKEKKIPFAATVWSSQWFSCFSRWSHCSIHHGLQTRPVQPIKREKTFCLLWGHFQKNPWLYPGKCVSLRQLHALSTNGLACPECPRADF